MLKKYLLAVSLSCALSASAFSSTEQQYPFYRDVVSVALFDSSIFTMDVNKYVSYPYIPIFWSGSAVVDRGVDVNYMHMFYHTQKIFSMSYGAALAYWRSRKMHQSFATASVFWAMQFWFLRSKYVRPYFIYSIAGPSYISREQIDGNDIGGHFTFRDVLGFGMQIGNKYPVDVSLRIGHFSNGNLLPTNPGIKVPAILQIGMAF
jgi:hypothetical protein